MKENCHLKFEVNSNIESHTASKRQEFLDALVDSDLNVSLGRIVVFTCNLEYTSWRRLYICMMNLPPI